MGWSVVGTVAATLDGTLLFDFGNEAVAKTAMLPRLPLRTWPPSERAAALRREGAFDHAPKDQHVDLRIAPMGRSIGRHRHRRRGWVGAPRLDPGDGPGLKLGYDPGGDVVIEARPVAAGSRVGMMSGIAALRDGRRETPS